MVRAFLLSMTALLVFPTISVSDTGFTVTTTDAHIRESSFIVEGTLKDVTFKNEAKRKRQKNGLLVTYNNTSTLEVTRVFKGKLSVGASIRMLIETECVFVQGKAKGIKRYKALINTSEQEPKAGDSGIWYLNKMGKGFRLKYFENPKSGISLLEADIRKTSFTEKEGMAFILANLSYTLANMDVENTVKGLKKFRLQSAHKTKQVKAVQRSVTRLEKQLKIYFEKGQFGHPKRRPGHGLNMFGRETFEGFRTRLTDSLFWKIRAEEKRLGVPGQMAPKT